PHRFRWASKYVTSAEITVPVPGWWAAAASPTCASSAPVALPPMTTLLAPVDSNWIWPLLFRNAFTLSPAVLTAFRMLFTVTEPPDVTVAVPVPSPMVMVLPLATGKDEVPVRLDTLPTTRLVNIGVTVKFAGVSSSDPGIDETADVVFG